MAFLNARKNNFVQEKKTKHDIRGKKVTQPQLNNNQQHQQTYNTQHNLHQQHHRPHMARKVLRC
jgi:hypothetical protein